jgi:hypothetical protein
VVYDNACLADAAGVGTSSFGACGAAPQGRFACGDLFCAKGVQFCMDKPGDGCGFGPHECRDLAPDCSAPGCVCGGLEAECLDGLNCSASADGDVTVSCINF